MLRIGEWCLNPASGQLQRNEETVRLEIRSLRLLLYLASRPGEVVSIEDVLGEVWPEVAVSQDSVYQAIAGLRRQLGDDSRQPTYIATVPRLGYQLVAAVGSCTSDEAKLAEEIKPDQKPVISKRPLFQGADFYRAGVVVAVLLLASVTGLGFLWHNRAGSPSPVPATGAASQESVAVLPFLDLTQGMKEGEFADGMTEELIDKLSKIPNLHVPSPTSSFYYRDKQLPVGDIARALGVAYLLDGSVRKSGATVRVAVRLTRADNGFVVWAETYDRAFTDILMVQDDIANHVAKQLRSSIQTGPKTASTQR
jgi:transcriptional activator of cad operon